MSAVRPVVSFAALLGHLLRWRRQELGLRQCDLVVPIGLVETTLSRIELGVYSPTVLQLRTICRALKMSAPLTLSAAEELADRLKANGIDVLEVCPAGSFSVGGAALASLLKECSPP